VEVVGTILGLIGLLALGASVWALIRGRFARARILNRKVAGGVLAGSLAVISAGGAMLPKDEPVRVKTFGPEYLADPASHGTSTTTISPSTTATTNSTTTATADPTTTSTPAAGSSTTGPGQATNPAPAAPAATTVKPLAPTTTSTTRPPSGGDPTAVLAGLRVAPEGVRAGYQRDLFAHWVDVDHDACDTREEVLITESRTRAQVDPYGCKVVAGDWYSSYDGLTFSVPSELDVDHMVPLAEAWDSGAASWDGTRRQAFANDLDHPQALRAVSASANRSKSDLDPGQWKPTRDAAWCEYANDWVTVKKAWDLSADQNEVDDLRVMLRTCNAASPVLATTGTTAAPTTTTTIAAPAVGSGTVTVTAVDCQGETVTVRNGGSSPADLTGWSIHDEASNHTYRLPAGYTLAPGGSVTIRSGGPAGPGELAWTNQSVWNNTGDTAYLVNAGAALVSTRSC
jgi:hypothetical protein